MQFIDTEKSLISRRDSTLLKGFLIILIVLGHNGILMGKAPGLSVTTLNDYLYSFHVYLFLILPFLYNIPQFTKERLKKDFLHIYKSYTLMCIALVFINTFLLNQEFNLWNTLLAFLSGNELKIKTVIGASFPWFMPTMFSLLLLRNYLLNKKNNVLLLSVALSFVLFTSARVFNAVSFYHCKFIVFGGMIATAYFSLAVISRYLYEKLSDKRYFKLISISTFAISTAIFFSYSPMSNIPFNAIRYAILPISALFTFIIFVNNLRNTYIVNVLEYFGKESLPIYMIHVFIYNFIMILIQKAQIPLDLLSGIISFILTIAITLLIIHLCKKTRIYKYLF